MIHDDLQLQKNVSHRKRFQQVVPDNVISRRSVSPTQIPLPTTNLSPLVIDPSSSPVVPSKNIPEHIVGILDIRNGNNCNF